MTERDALIQTERVIPLSETNPMDGQVCIAWTKTIWLTLNMALSIIALIGFPQLDALVLFICMTAVTVCAGHSVGMHRYLIHQSFRTYRSVAYVLVWLGTLVGMAGPFGMIKAHDMRDWHQRQRLCPDHAAHRTGLLRDAWWQLCCRYDLRHPPRLVIERRLSNDQFYVWLERTWMLQQVPVGVLLYAFGGWAFVLWGVSVRISVSLIGHWCVGHFAHNAGQQGWSIEGVAVQGYDLPRLSVFTFGESWHGNHHAFPYSAKLGVKSGQTDLGYQFISWLAARGLVWDVQVAGDAPDRAGLVQISDRDTKDPTLTSSASS